MAMTRGLLALVPTEQPLLIKATPDMRILLFTLGLTMLTGVLFGLCRRFERAGRSVDHVEGHGGIDCGHRRFVVSAEGPGGRPGGAELPAAVRRGTIRAQPAEPADDRDRIREIDNLVTFQVSPALNGYDAPRTVHFYQDLLDRLQTSRRASSRAGYAAVRCSREMNGIAACRSKDTRPKTARTCRHS